MLTVELRHLEYFAAVAAELKFSRAAQRIHVVQSALSAAVSRLEKELGVELFDRSKRQIALTAAGEGLSRARPRSDTHRTSRAGVPVSGATRADARAHGLGLRIRPPAGGSRAGATHRVADYAITAELIRHRLATTILPSSFPDLRTVPLHPAITWTLSIAYAASRHASPAINALIDTLIRHVGQSA
jgi:DNA-binding transcriptional LysR family regulator